jgi:hypothetical protein
LINTENTDLNGNRKELSRIRADERGLGRIADWKAKTLKHAGKEEAEE